MGNRGSPQHHQPHGSQTTHVRGIVPGIVPGIAGVAECGAGPLHHQWVRGIGRGQIEGGRGKGASGGHDPISHSRPPSGPSKALPNPDGGGPEGNIPDTTRGCKVNSTHVYAGNMNDLGKELGGDGSVLCVRCRQPRDKHCICGSWHRMGKGIGYHPLPQPTSEDIERAESRGITNQYVISGLVCVGYGLWQMRARKSRITPL